MNLLRWMAVSFSMYSIIPMPKFEWKEDDMAHSLTFFPVVGIVIGGLVYGLNSMQPFMDLPVAVRIILTILLPLFITGGIHVDGFMDTEDAINSYGTREKKLEILKDPHIGAFAVISLIKWVLFYGAAVTAILLNEKCDVKIMTIYGMIFVASRCISGLSSIFFEKAKKQGMLYEETRNRQTGTIVVLIAVLVFAFGVMVAMNLLCGLAVSLISLIYALYYKWKTKKEFGGVTGDTAGFLLTTAEIISTAALAVTLYLT